ncbi:membrane glycosyltransferase [Bacillus sp. 153480037-1]
MEFKAIILFAIFMIILFLINLNNIMLFAIKHNKMKKASAISYMILSVFSGIAISSFLIWKFFIS